MKKPHKKVISFAEAEDLLGSKNPLQWSEPDEVVWYEGNTKLAGDIDLDNDGAEGVLVTGNLELEGSVINTNSNVGGFLVVTGSLKAKNIVAGGSEVYVLKGATIENVILGHYNDGSLYITGKTKARVIINEGHDCQFKPQDPEGIKIKLNTHGEDFRNADFYDEDGPNIFEEEFIDPRGSDDIDEIMRAILDGKEFLKKDVKTAEETIQEGSANRVDLSRRRFRVFPEKLTSLQRLEYLHLSNCELKALPRGIGKLSHLKFLDVSNNEEIELPKELGQLKNLRRLEISQCLTKFPEVIAQLENLEELEMDGVRYSRFALKEFPLSLTQLKRLTKLEVMNHEFKTISEEALNLENLEELNLWNSLNAIKSLPDFSGLKKLKTLRLGYCGLQAFPETISNLSYLKTLDLGSNDIAHFPESFYRLTSLESVNLSSNKRLTLEEVQKLTTRLPHAKFIVTGIPFRQEVNDERWQKVHRLVEAASKYMKDDPAKLLKSFDEAIALCVPGQQWSEFDYLRAQYGKMRCLARMSHEDPAEMARLAAERNAIAKTCLQLAREQETPYFCDESVVRCDVVRYACNMLARDLLERAKPGDTENLEQALRFAGEGIAWEDGGDYRPYRPSSFTDFTDLISTKAQILLKLGRVEEAYVIVRRSWGQHASHGLSYEFTKIRKSDPYKAWLKKTRGY